MEEFDKQIHNCVGDVFVAAACVAYYGAFTSVYRDELVEKWTETCRTEVNILSILLLLVISIAGVSTYERVRRCAITLSSLASEILFFL